VGPTCTVMNKTRYILNNLVFSRQPRIIHMLFFRFENWIWYSTNLCTQSNLSQSTPHNNVRQQFTCLRSKLFVANAAPSWPSVTRVINTRPLLSICKKLWMPPPLSLNLAPYIVPQMSYRRLVHAHWSNNFVSRNTASKLHQSLVFMFSR
jgi:hypothetical protein